MRNIISTVGNRLRDLGRAAQFPFFGPQFAAAEVTCVSSAARPAAAGISMQDLLSAVWNMAVPKSRVSDRLVVVDFADPYITSLPCLVFVRSRLPGSE
jgi:hypothetical protein